MRYAVLLLILSVQPLRVVGEEYVCTVSEKGVTETHKFKRVEDGFVGQHMFIVPGSSTIESYTYEYSQGGTSDMFKNTYLIENQYSIGFLELHFDRLTIQTIDLSSMNYIQKLLFVEGKKSTRSDGSVVDHNEYYESGSCVMND